MADFTTRDKVTLLKDFLNVVGTETEGVEVKVTRDADNGMRFYSDPEVVVEVKNATLAQIDAGTPVYVSGTHASGKPEVSPAQANSATTMPAIGLVQDDIASGDEGFVVAGGLVVGLDTDTPAWDDGTPLYVSPTVAGGLTDTRPTGTTELVQKVALVTRRHEEVGSVIVMGAGRTNDIPNDLVTLTGVSLGDSDLGTFTGTTIADNETIKGALQDLETAVEAGGGGGIKYHGRYDTEAETARSDATTTTEIYYTARPDGDGYAESEVDDTGETDTINRTLFFSDKFEADPDTSADWTQYTTQPAANATFATAKAALLAGLNDTDGTANTRGTLPVSLKMERTTTPPLLFDSYGGARVAYSVRKLGASYSGSCMRVREDSGNTETDIGFDSNGLVDTAAIATHCGSANGYVTTWYDQSGNGDNATQTTASQQPLIYNGTAVHTQNGKPALQFDATNDQFSFDASTTNQPFTWFAVFQMDNDPSSVALGWNVFSFLGRYYSQNMSLYAASYLGSASFNVTTQQVVYALANGSSSELQFNGTKISGNAGTRNMTGAGFIGCDTNANNDFAGDMQEIVLYDSNQSSNLSGIDGNLNSYYSVY